MNDDLMSQEELDALLQEYAQKKESAELETDNYLDVMEQDTLAEIGNISMGSAATVLSTLSTQGADHRSNVYVSTARAWPSLTPSPVSW